MYAKINTLEGVKNYEEILSAADGIVIHRAELALELAAEKLMLAQKWMLDKAGSEGKPVFLESQILDSMLTEDKATRLEAEDITSGILEGADSFILTNETSVGPYPAEAVI